MKIPLCNFCVKSGILCQRCQEKVSSGEFGDTAINIAKLLLKLEDKYPTLQKASFYNAYQVENIIAIIVGNGDLHRFLSGGRVILRAIAENTGKKIKILEKAGGEREFFEALFAPAMITSINKIWLPDGSIETRVIIAGYYRRLPLKSKILKDLAKKVRGVTLRIAFENQPGKEF